MSEEQLKAMEPSAPLLVAEVRRLQIALDKAEYNLEWEAGKVNRHARETESVRKMMMDIRDEIYLTLRKIR